MVRPATVDVVDLVVRGREGDAEALLGLAAAFDPSIRRFVASKRGAAEVDDVVNEVWAQVLAGMPRLEEPAAFPGWVWTIAERTVYRTTMSVRRPVGASLDRTDEPWSSLESVLDAERVEAIKAALLEVPPSHAQMFIDRVWRERSPCDIAAELGTTPGYIRKVVSQVRTTIRAKVGDLKALWPFGFVASWWRPLRESPVLPQAAAGLVMAGAAIVAGVAVPGAASSLPPSPDAAPAAARGSGRAATGHGNGDDGRPDAAGVGHPGTPSQRTSSGAGRDAPDGGDEWTELVGTGGHGLSIGSPDAEYETEPDATVSVPGVADVHLWVWEHVPAGPPTDATTAAAVVDDVGR